MIRVIPNKNQNFETEKRFLEKKHRQGFRLQKKGWLFYQFMPTTPSEVAYEIDLAPRKTENFETDPYLDFSGDWEIVLRQSALYKNFEKIYYLNTDSQKRFLVDEKTQISYCKQKIALWFLLALPLILALILLFMSTTIRLSSFAEAMLPYLLFFSFFLAILTIIKVWPLLIWKASLDEKIFVEFEGVIVYVVSFLNPTVEQKNEFDENFLLLGKLSVKLKRTVLRIIY